MEDGGTVETLHKNALIRRWPDPCARGREDGVWFGCALPVLSGTRVQNSGKALKRGLIDKIIARTFRSRDRIACAI